MRKVDNYEDKVASRYALRNRAKDRDAIDRIIARTMVLDVCEEDEEIADEVEAYTAAAEKREMARKEKKAGKEAIEDEYSDDGPVIQWEDFDNEEQD